MFKPIYQQEKTSLLQILIFSPIVNNRRGRSFPRGGVMTATQTTLWQWHLRPDFSKIRWLENTRVRAT
jgi:hypothetical protein